MNGRNFSPQRILLILPCCIGDVVLATATLAALRCKWRNAHITWAVGGWSKAAVEHHPMLDAIMDTGDAALPVRSISGMMHFVRQVRAGQFDLLVSLVRSPLMSVAALLSGVLVRAGLDSAGRGFGYTVRAPIDPNAPRHEAEIYLDVPRALGIDTAGLRANVPVRENDAASVRGLLADRGVIAPYLVIHAGGGRNPGMTMTSKRYPPHLMAELTGRLAAHLNAQIVIIGAADDAEAAQAIASAQTASAHTFINALTFGQIAALAKGARLFIGSDTGLTHLAAAAGGKTVMIMGPSDPARYAPYADDAIALWKPTALHAGGVAAGVRPDWDWERDGISVDEAEIQIRKFAAGG